MSETVLQDNKEIQSKDEFTKLQGLALIFLTLFLSVGGYFLVGKYYVFSNLDMKRVNAQLEYYQEKVKNEPDKLDYRIGLGYTYFLKGDNSKAVKEFNQVLEMDKNYYDAYYNLGLIYADEGRLDDALDMFEKAVEIAPKDYKGHLQKGVTYRKLGMLKEAGEALNQANRLMPANVEIIYQIGVLAEAEGDKNMATQIYKEALGYDPLYKEAIEALKRLEQLPGKRRSLYVTMSIL